MAAGSGSDGSMSMPRYFLRPVAAGISFPMITFSLSPSSRSTLPSMAASVRTFVVSWKDAAERNDSVASEAFVMPRMSGSNVARSPFAERAASFARSSTTLSASCPGRSSVSPGVSTRTFFIIWRTMSSMCLSWMSTPCDL